jgi:hypothetical protein
MSWEWRCLSDLWLAARPIGAIAGGEPAGNVFVDVGIA